MNRRCVDPRLRILALLFLILNLAATMQAQQPEIFFYMHKDSVRQGCFYKPEGNGPFPAIIYNQATPKPAIQLGEPKPFLTLAKFYVSQGYILFLPGRPVISDSVPNPSTEKKAAVRLSEEELMTNFARHSENLIAALDWVKAQAIVDVNRVYMSGHAIGGIQALLMADKSVGIRGYIAFSPGAKLWDEYAGLRTAVETAVAKQKAPIFLVQPQNDIGFGPSIALGPQLAKASLPNRTKIYDAYGKSQAEGHSLAFNAPHVWGTDVLDFMTLCRASSGN